jgi:anti-sigma B factor antagonist
MDCEKSPDGKKLNVQLVGKVDSMNVYETEEKLLKEAEGVTDITFDLAKLEYISSSGLHMLLQIQNMMKMQGNMVIINTNEKVMEIFKDTGFVRMLNIA